MIREGPSIDPRALHAARAIRETEAFLSEAMIRPEAHVRIPVVRVGYGSFPPGLSLEFWNRVLGMGPA
jgi:hypothetical protein